MSIQSAACADLAKKVADKAMEDAEAMRKDGENEFYEGVEYLYTALKNAGVFEE